MAESLQVHVSVRRLDKALEVYLCKTCPSYHCPLCPTEKVKFTAAHEAVGHIQNHLTWTVVHGCFKVYKCHLSCHDKPHYHCPSCPKRIVRRCDYTTHIQRHPRLAATPPGSPSKGPPGPPVGSPCPPAGPPIQSVGPPDPHEIPDLSGPVASRLRCKVERRPQCDVHDSVRRLDNALEVYLCKTCPSYHCPLCPTEKVEFKSAHEAVGHIQNHLTWTVVHGCFKVYKCHHSCHNKPHYHCPSCPKRIVRRCDYTTHILRHPRLAATLGSSGSPEERPVSVLLSSASSGPPGPPIGPPGPPIGPPDPSVAPPAHSDGPYGSLEEPSVGPPDRQPRPAVPRLAVARVKLKVVICPKCDLRLYAKNLKTHLLRRHAPTNIDFTAPNQLADLRADVIKGVDTTALLKT